MNFRLVIRKKAERHITSAYNWYEEQRLGLGHEFVFCIDAKLQGIVKNPQLFQIKHKNIHCALVPRFPYGIFYFIDEDKIVVVAVFHLSRNPKLWKR